MVQPTIRTLGGRQYSAACDVLLEALRISPIISSEQQHMVKLGTFVPHQSAAIEARQIIWPGLLWRRIPCCLDETKPAFSITLSPSNEEVGAWSNDDASVTIDDHLDQLAYDLAVQNCVQRFSESNIAHSAEAVSALQEIGPCSEDLDRRIRLAIQTREASAALALGICQWHRSRLLVVGQARAGKTAFVASLY